MEQGGSGRVGRRRVFYIPGYDPFPSRRYRELYRTEGAAQAAISGHRLTVARSGAGWRVDAVIEDQTVVTEVEVLGWSDLVRASMDRGIVATYGALARTAWVYGRSGALWRLASLRKGPVLAALYPVAMLLGQAGLALLAAWAVARLLGLALPGWIGWSVGLVAAASLLRWFRQADRRLYAHYLMHDFAYTATQGGAHPPELEARIGVFRARIAAAMTSDADEVLVVGHSSGAHLAVSALAGLLRDGKPGGPDLGLLTLGQVIPMVSFLPRATGLRRDLHDLARSDRLTWVDVSAPGDGCCFALCDPVAVSGVAPPDKRWPLVISAAFSRTIDPARLRALRWRFFRLHFQYLCAFDHPRDYDYFAITAGPLTLSRRFAGRAPSPNRIDVAVTGHTDRAA